jgi:hypothetical protein
MRLIFENFRKFLNEQEDHRRSELGMSTDPEKEKLIKTFSDDLEKITSNRRIMLQVLEVILYPEKKPLFYHGLSSNVQFSPQFENLLEQKGIIYKTTRNAIYVKGKKPNTAFFLGIPENVNKAIELQKYPFLGIEKMGYPEEFIIHMKKLRDQGELSAGLVVTPDFQIELGKLLGYGEENAVNWTNQKIKPDWDNVFNNWKLNQTNPNAEPTEVL